MVETLKAHELEIGSRHAVPSGAAACGTEVHSVDVTVREFEVEGRLIHGEAHPEVILGRSLQIRDHPVSVEKEVGTGPESHEWMQRRVVLPHLGIPRVSARQIEKPIHAVSRDKDDQSPRQKLPHTALSSQVRPEPCQVGGKNEGGTEHAQPDRRPGPPAHALVGIHGSTYQHEKRQGKHDEP